MDNNLLNHIISMVLQAAADARDSAGYSGSFGDGGASILETQVKFYRYGMEGIIPPGWRQYQNQVEKEADPEYKEYLRLQNKFNK